ncbi:MAG: hypothetical protein NTY38_27575, partial [Acidobacteria bacterium]|nr:hypothetical protein [Acidobacteriota bacterium]
GESATIQFRTSAEAALGIAIVDQSVFERAATDSAFTHPRWFDALATGEPNLNGITARDLENLDSAKIDADLELAAQLLVRPPQFLTYEAVDLGEQSRNRFGPEGQKVLEPVRVALDRHYLGTLRYPRNEAELSAALGYGNAPVNDPWLRPYFPRFEIQGSHALLRWMSSGPDKLPGTSDDYCALTVRREWFAPYQALISRRLDGAADFPGSEAGFLGSLEELGIRFPALRDPWGSGLRLTTEASRDRREFHILSAGPDRNFGTNDDFTVARFGGLWFARWDAKIGNVFSAPREFPRNSDEFRSHLRSAGIDFNALRDPWNHPLYLTFRQEQMFTDRVRLYSYREFEGNREERKQVTPFRRTVLVAEIRCAGSEGVQGTHGDLPVATYRHFAG